MRHGWHLHGGWEGVQAALALQRLAGLLQVCDSGWRLLHLHCCLWRRQQARQRP